MIWRIRDRATFSRFGRGSIRARQGPISVICALDPRAATEAASGCPPRVAYAVGREVGSAVVRNGIRRRLRASLRAHEELLVEGAAYLVRVAPPAVQLDPDVLDRAVTLGLREVRDQLVQSDQA